MILDKEGISNFPGLWHPRMGVSEFDHVLPKYPKKGKFVDSHLKLLLFLNNSFPDLNKESLLFQLPSLHLLNNPLVPYY